MMKPDPWNEGYIIDSIKSMRLEMMRVFGNTNMRGSALQSIHAMEGRYVHIKKFSALGGGLRRAVG